MLLRRLAAALDAPDGVARGEHLLVAVSGGPDSTALLAGLAELAPARGLRLTAAYLDHGLRGAEGAGEATRVATLAARLGAGFVTEALALADGPDLEARARRARYRALGILAARVVAARIVTGHTRDDQVETVLLRLLRGAGRRGLGGMRASTGRLLRPLLGATRTDVRRFLADRGLDFAVDRSNADLRRTRNRVRRLLIPFLEQEFNPRLGPALAALAIRLRDEDHFLAGAAADRAPTHRDGEALRVAVVAEPPALARRILRAWLEEGPAHAVTAKHVERVLALAGHGGRGVVALPGPARVVREGDRLVVRAGRAAAAGGYVLPIAPGETASGPDGRWCLTLSTSRPRRPGESRPASPGAALFDAGTLPPGLVVRSPDPGDRVRVLGGGTRKLQDVLVDAKVPREGRPAVAVLAAGADILWVAGLVRGRTAAVRETTVQVVDGRFEPRG